MKIDVVIGGMYGDEGKGKIVNFLSNNNYDYVFRVNASTNASHTVKFENDEFIAKQLPSVFFNNKTELVIAPGAILNMSKLFEELNQRKDLNFIKNKVHIASNIPLLIPPYIYINKSSQSLKDIGSTNQGTGIAVMARVMKHCLRLYDIDDVVKGKMTKSKLIEKIKHTCNELNVFKEDSYYKKIADDLTDVFTDIKNIIGSFCIDYTAFISKLKEESSILIEGCNGVLLDNIHGVHPYTTSTSTSINSLLNGANLSPYCLNNAYIVTPAYSCCLNKRPFVSEMNTIEANKIYKYNSEIDPAESMQRRIGWLDLVALRKVAVGHKGCCMILNKVDVLKDFEEIKVVTHYKLQDDSIVDLLPDNTNEIEKATPICKTFKGWGDVSNIDNSEKLPQELKSYIKCIEAETGLIIKYIGNGNQTNNIISI